MDDNKSIVLASELEPPATIKVGDDNKSHIVDAFGDAWCETDVEMYDTAPDADCPGCVDAFREEQAGG